MPAHFCGCAFHSSLQCQSLKKGHRDKICAAYCDTFVAARVEEARHSVRKRHGRICQTDRRNGWRGMDGGVPAHHEKYWPTPLRCKMHMMCSKRRPKRRIAKCKPMHFYDEPSTKREDRGEPLAKPCPPSFNLAPKFFQSQEILRTLGLRP